MTALEVSSVSLHYGAAIALRGVSVSTSVGSVTCVMGRNGVGKTSLLRAIMGTHPITEGEIRWEGADISRLSTYERARCGIAWVPQGREIFPLLTVKENLETMMYRRGGDLSGGQQQQLAIARALVMRPRLLLLDEPTEGIQPSIIKDIGRIIELLRARGNIAILLVEQYFDFARGLAQNIAVMERGSIVLAGARGEIDEEDVRRRLSV